MSGEDVAIAVPVRDEVERLPALLQALHDQVRAPRFSLCLFFDNCTDDSEALVRSLAPALRYAVHTACSEEGGAPSAGRARSAAMALAARRAPGGILLTTDADGEPAADWIAANLLALDTADVVAGRIVRQPDPPSRRQDRIEAYYDRLHALRRSLDPVPWDPRPGHHWTSAASIALAAATYREIGGFPAVANGEDAALCDAAARAGFTVRRDARVVVRTSARRLGRAEGGFAAALSQLDRADAMPLTLHPDDEAWRFRMQAAARMLHGSGDYAQLSAQLGLPLAEVALVAAQCRNGEAFAARIVGDPPAGCRQVPLDDAERLLAGIVEAELVAAG